MAVNEVLKKAVNEVKFRFELTQAEIADKLEVKSTYLSDMINGRVPLSENISSKIEELFGVVVRNKDTSCELRSPEESHNEEPAPTGKVIPLYDAEAAAGIQYGMNMEAVSRPIGMIEIGSILKDSESALRVYGNSMTPNYPAGCVVGLRPHADSFIEPGSVYVVETNENRYLKRLYYNAHKTAFRCVSDNHMVHDGGPMNGDFYYPDFEIPFDEVRRLCRVVGVIKRNIL